MFYPYVFDLERQHKERVAQLAYDYQQGVKAQKAIKAFASRQWQHLMQTVNAWRRGMGSGPRTPELHY